VLGWLKEHHVERLRDGYFDMSEANSLTGEAADYMAVNNTGGTEHMEFSHENVSDNNLDLNFMTEPVEFTPLEANFAVPLLTDQLAMRDQTESVVVNETCRLVNNPRTEMSFMVCEQHID